MLFTSYDLLEHLINIIRDYPEQSLTTDFIDRSLLIKLNIDKDKLSSSDKKSLDKNKEKALKALKKLGYIDKKISGKEELWYVNKSITHVVIKESFKEVEIEDIVSNVKRDDAYNGIALALTFIIFSLFFYLSPSFFEYKYLSYGLSILFAVIGIIGIGIELNRLSDSKEGIFDNLGIGIGLGLLIIFIWVIVSTYLISAWYINIIFTISLILPIYGILLGSIYLFDRLFLEQIPTRVRFFIRLPLAIIQIAGAFLIVVQILSMFGVDLIK